MRQLLCRFRTSRVVVDGVTNRSSYLLTLSRRSNSSSVFRVNIGDVTLLRTLPKNLELVPVNYASEKANKSQTVLRHIRWMMQKDKLKQDIFLIGPPGALKRTLTMQYLELTKKEVEYVSLSRDTTESDIKQRREIKDRTAHYVDQCAVRAAVEGRTLILDGIEKAERNVLPILNNLLENREMHLEDGRFLMAAERYDKLLETYSKEEMDKLNLVRVSKDFQVIALGLPVPRYRGNPLDPPLRSRFQARDINPLPFQEYLEILKGFGSSVPNDRLIMLLSAAYTLNSPESKSLGLPDFPLDQLPYLVKLMEKIPGLPLHQLLTTVYPYDLFLGKEGQNSVKDVFSKFDITAEKISKPPEVISSIENLSSEIDSYITANITEKVSRKKHSYKVLAGTSDRKASGDAEGGFVNTDYLKCLFSEILHSHAVKDFCIVGSRGCGKSATIEKFANFLGYETELVTLYADMTARDLLQQRTTQPNGDTDWKFAPLVTAALNGNLAILDGLHRINPGTLAVIHRLVHDRELQLFNGVRLLRADRYNKIKHHNEWTDQDMKNRGTFRIHPSFRLVALSEPPVVGSSTQQWLNAELLTLFFFHHMHPLSLEQELEVIAGVANVEKSAVEKIVQLTHALRSSSDITLQSVASSLSLRQLIRIARRIKHHSNENEYSAVQKACLGRFLPPLTKLALNQTLENFNIPVPQFTSTSIEDLDRAITCEVKQGRVRIGSTEHNVFVPDSMAQVPDVLFYDNVQHLTVMEDMLKDFILGEHLLLVGNQGVGKNKIVDRFLHLLNRPREYIQLHRDTTIQSLTLQPTVQDGVIQYEDSPLVSAVKFGKVLVIDEADKAPTNVTCILKTLVESGNMLLADGRRIMKRPDGCHDASIIKMHPDFRMIVLANRPGFPFLGNDFFGALGDIFSCHAVDNPSMESEVEMLQKYGPNVPVGIVRKLVEAFDELRSMADQGLIAYPYSTREIVNIIKHLEAYPNEALTTVVRNVFDFDPYSEDMWETLKNTLLKHGIPIGVETSRINLAKEFSLPEPTLISTWDMKRQYSGSSLPLQRKEIVLKQYPSIDVVTDTLDRIDSRTLEFTEEAAHWKLPVTENNVVLDVAVTKNGHQMTDMIHVVTGNPVQLLSMTPATRNVNVLDVFRVFNYTRGVYEPRVKLAALSNRLAGQVVLHEGVSNRVFLISPWSGEIVQLTMESLLQATAKQISYRMQGIDKGFYRMCSDVADQNMILFYQYNGDTIDVMELDKNEAYNVMLPFKIDNVKIASADHWMVVEKNTKRKHLVKKATTEHGDEVMLLCEINEQPLSDLVVNMGTESLSSDALKMALGKTISAPNRIFNSGDSYAMISIGFPELESNLELHSFQRLLEWVYPDITLYPRSVIHSSQSQIVSAVPKRYHPDYENVSSKELTPAYLEVVDLADKKLRYIPIPSAQTVPPYTKWLSEISPSHVLIAGTSMDGLVTVDAGGCVRLWETAIATLKDSMDAWRTIRGVNSNEKLQLTVDAPAPDLKDLEEPKHGKVDPLNTPHFGGSTWAGGTGGRSTAGLGGIGGPYRLDAGHDVHQVPDFIKENVPEEVRRAAREMGQRAYKEKLRQIKMSEYDAELYEQLISNIKTHIQSLKVILDSLQAKSKERQWLKHQTYGELDDLKLIDSITGEKAVYKRRGEKEPEMGAPQEKPKRLKLLVDVSGSMYRFNGYDGRLNRIMESALLVMEAFEKYDAKFQYDILGHSGEEYALPFVTSKNLPTNNKEKLDILKKMHAHAQFCMSGDNTLEATAYATETLAKEDADERFLIMLSDANLDRYGIRPQSLVNVLTADPEVNSFAIFIGSLGDQAVRLQKALPSGRGFVCLDTKLIPDIMRQIFTSSLLQK